MQTIVTHNGTELTLSQDYEVSIRAEGDGTNSVRIMKRVDSYTDIDSNLANLFSAHLNSQSITVKVETVDDAGDVVELHNDTYAKIRYTQIISAGVKTDMVHFFM